jgi:hypothetical protein
VAGKFEMHSAYIGQHLFMCSVPQQHAEFSDISLIFAAVEGNLDVRGAVLSSLDLTRTRIGGELDVGVTFTVTSMEG